MKHLLPSVTLLREEFYIGLLVTVTQKSAAPEMIASEAQTRVESPLLCSSSAANTEWHRLLTWSSGHQTMLHSAPEKPGPGRVLYAPALPVTHAFYLKEGPHEALAPGSLSPSLPASPELPPASRGMGFSLPICYFVGAIRARMRVMLESEMQEGSDEQHKRGKNGRVLKTILPFPEHLSCTKRIVEMGFKSMGWEQLKKV